MPYGGLSSLVTLKDVAKRAGVSIATASRVINGGDNVAAESKKRVLEAIQELGYYSNEVARSLRQEYLKIISVTLPGINNLFYTEMLQGIDDVTSINGYSVLFNDTTENDEIEKQSLKMIRSLRIAGSILFHLGGIDNELIQLCDTTFPSMLINSVRRESIGRITFIPYDVKSISKLAFDYLQSKYQPTDVWFFSPILHGEFYMDEALITQAPFRLHWILSGITPRDAKRVCLQQADLGKIPAFVTTNDFQAMGVVEYLREKKEPIRLISFGNTMLAQNLEPQLTSVGPSGYDLGVSVASELITRIEGGKSQNNLPDLVIPEIIIRET